MLVSTYRPGTLTMLECRFNKTTHHVIIIIIIIRTIHSSRRNRIMEPPDVGEKHHILCIEMLSKECQHGRQ